MIFANGHFKDKSYRHMKVYRAVVMCGYPVRPRASRRPFPTATMAGLYAVRWAVRANRLAEYLASIKIEVEAK